MRSPLTELPDRTFKIKAAASRGLLFTVSGVVSGLTALIQESLEDIMSSYKGTMQVQVQVYMQTGQGQRTIMDDHREHLLSLESDIKRQ